MNRTVLTAIIVCLIFVTPCMAGGQTIDRITVEGLHHMDRVEFLELMGLHIGDRLDPVSVRYGIKRTWLTDRFENIIVLQDDEDPHSIIIKVKEKYVIDDIDVEGVNLLSDNDIVKAFPIKEKDLFDLQRLEPALRTLERDLTELGYPGTRVEGTVKRNETNHTVTIKLVVDEGTPLIIRMIKVLGLKEQDAIDRVQIFLDVYTGDIFNRNELSDRLRELKDRYKKEGYYHPVVGPFDYKDGVLTLTIDPGKLLVVKFRGNTYFTASRLREETLFRDIESIDNEVVEEASARIVTLYRETGFAFAQVAPVIKVNEDSAEVVFFIFEGNQVYIDDVDISGNSIDDELIRKVLSIEDGAYFNPDNIDTYRKTLTEFYYALGYHEAVVEEIRYEYNSMRTGADLFITVSEGTHTLIGGIFFYGNKVLSERELRDAVKLAPLSHYNEISISDARYALIDLYKQKGYIDVSVTVKRRISHNRAYLEFHITEGNRYYFGYTIIRGNRDVRERVITRELVNEKGEPFNMMLLRRNTQKLHKLGLFSAVDFTVFDDIDHQKSVILDVKEANAGLIKFGVGYGDYEKLRGFFDVSYRNFFGMNRHGQARIELSTLSEKYIISAYEPWLYNFPGLYSPLSLRTGALYERRTEKNIDTGETRYKTRRYEVNANLEMNFAERIKGEMLYTLSHNKTTEVKPDVVLTKEDIGTLLISAVSPSLIYDSRNNPYNPQKGVLAGLSMELASRYFGSETDYIKYEFKSGFYYSLFKGLVAAVSLRGGIAEGHEGTKQLPIIKRFFLGGRNTVRGYVQDSLGPKGDNGDPTGGNVFLMHNLELRLHIYKSLGVVAFMDGGNVWLTRDDVNLDDYKFTAGGGLRYMTPVGPFRLDYGYKLNREEGESEGEIHFSIGHAF